MDDNILNSGVLVLNKSWMPIRVQNLRRAISKVTNNRAKFVDPETFLLYSWEEWLKSFAIPNKDTENLDYEIIRSKNFSFKKPFVAVCTKYNKIPNTHLKLTKRNLLIRDHFKCMYSGEKLSYKTATVDHVVPKSKGGKTTWDNLVICSFEVNIKKANRTPEEAGLKLLKIPKKPQWSPVYEMIHKSRSKYWGKFIKDEQWKIMDKINEDTEE